MKMAKVTKSDLSMLYIATANQGDDCAHYIAWRMANLKPERTGRKMTKQLLTREQAQSFIKIFQCGDRCGMTVSVSFDVAGENGGATFDISENTLGRIKVLRTAHGQACKVETHTSLDAFKRAYSKQKVATMFVADINGTATGQSVALIYRGKVLKQWTGVRAETGANLVSAHQCALDMGFTNTRTEYAPRN